MTGTQRRPKRGVNNRVFILPLCLGQLARVSAPHEMSEEEHLSPLEVLEREEARLRELLDKIAIAKEVFRALPGGLAKAASQFQDHAPTAAIAKASTAHAYDGTVASLAYCYRHDPRSTYHQLKSRVRDNYDGPIDRMVAEIGDERVEDLNALRIQDLYKSSWAAGGKLATGHIMVGKLRLLSSFGSTVLDDDGCTRLSAILGNLRFPLPKARGERLTTKHVNDIRAVAGDIFGWRSIALAQSFQFELPQLKQIDVIGEWVPIGEPGTSEIMHGNEKWLHGLRWSDLDENMVLRRTLTSGRQSQKKEIEIDLKKNCPMVVDELSRIPPWNRQGPIVLNEATGKPWKGSEYRRKWRKVADKAGVPKSIKNMDSIRADPDADELEELTG